MTEAIVLVSTPGHLNLDAFCRATGLHPVMVTRLVALGLIDAVDETPHFEESQVARACRIQRLREDLGINYAALGLVLDLLDRVEELEAAVRRAGGGRP